MAGSSKGPSKTKLVTDLDDAYKKLNLTLTKTKDLSADIAKNLQGLNGNGGGGASSMSSANLPSFLNPWDVFGGGGGNGSSKSSSSSKSGWGSAALTMLGATATAATNAVSSNDYIMNSAMSSRFGFFAGKGNQENSGYASGKFQSMSNAGTPISNLDAANAASFGNSIGLMSGLKNYNTISNSAAGISNIMPGVGLEAGMGAIASLNQGASVNKLRMIGINVRDQNGYMRDVESIARDLWKVLTNTKSGKGNITASDLSFSLQSGNSLDMMLNQYFGSDAVLRQSIISYLYQFAQEGGSSPSYTTEEGKQALLKSGADTSVSQSAARRQAAGYNVTNAYTSAGITGIKGANDFLTGASNFFANNAGMSAASGFVTATTTAETIAGAGNGGGGAILQGISSTLSDVFKSNAGLTKTVMMGLIATATASIVSDLASGKSINFSTSGGGGGSSSGGSATYSPGETNKGWSSKLLSKLGMADTQSNNDAVQAWVTHEGGLNQKGNPLNITHLNKNNKSVVSRFATEDEGLAATASLLKNNPKYKGIMNALKAGNDEGATWAAIATSPWDADNYGTNKKGQAQYYGPGGTININITGADLKDSKKLAKDIKDQIDEAIRLQGARG